MGNACIGVRREIKSLGFQRPTLGGSSAQNSLVNQILIERMHDIHTYAHSDRPRSNRGKQVLFLHSWSYKNRLTTSLENKTTATKKKKNSRETFFLSFLAPDAKLLRNIKLLLSMWLWQKLLFSYSIQSCMIYFRLFSLRFPVTVCTHTYLYILTDWLLECPEFSQSALLGTTR